MRLGTLPYHPLLGAKAGQDPVRWPGRPLPEGGTLYCRLEGDRVVPGGPGGALCPVRADAGGQTMKQRIVPLLAAGPGPDRDADPAAPGQEAGGSPCPRAWTQRRGPDRRGGCPGPAPGRATTRRLYECLPGGYPGRPDRPERPGPGASRCSRRSGPYQELTSPPRSLAAPRGRSTRHRPAPVRSSPRTKVSHPGGL